jgi:hypothetical protein
MWQTAATADTETADMVKGNPGSSGGDLLPITSRGANPRAGIRLKRD